MLACGAYYYIGSNPKFRKQTLQFFISSPDLETNKDILFLVDGLPYKKLFYRFLPPIDKCEVIRVPKLDTKITMHSIFNLPNYSNLDELK